MYSYIINPNTNRKVNVNSKLGKEIIMNYVYWSKNSTKSGGYINNNQETKIKMKNFFFNCNWQRC